MQIQTSLKHTFRVCNVSVRRQNPSTENYLHYPV